MLETAWGFFILIKLKHFCEVLRYTIYSFTISLKSIMITTIILWAFLLSCLDTLFGNRIFPGKTGVLKMSERDYIVYKIHRYFFIPLKAYIYFDDDDRTMLNFSSSRSSARSFYQERAISLAKVYANKKEDNNCDSSEVIEVWNSRMKDERVKQSAQDLLAQFSEALAKDDEERIIKIAKSLNNGEK